jgi:hypothetical protein
MSIALNNSNFVFIIIFFGLGNLSGSHAESASETLNLKRQLAGQLGREICPSIGFCLRCTTQDTRSRDIQASSWI